MFKALLPLMLVSSNAFASQACYKAADTSMMKASIENENSKFDEFQQIVEASLVLYTNSKYKDSNGVLKLADLSITTANGVKALASSFLHQGVYSVECDGGNMNVQKNSDGSVTLKTERIRADIEGCDGTVDISTFGDAGTKFEQVLCPAPATI